MSPTPTINGSSLDVAECVCSAHNISGDDCWAILIVLLITSGDQTFHAYIVCSDSSHPLTVHNYRTLEKTMDMFS